MNHHQPQNAATGRGDDRACAEERETARDTAREALARVIWETSRADEGTISATGADIVANAILASPALDAVVAERVTALAEDEKFVEQLTPNLHGGGETARHPQFARFRTRHMLRALAAVLRERGQS